MKIGQIPRARLGLYALCLILVLSLATGCSTLYRQTYAPTGRILTLYGSEELTPYLMGTNDITMACSMAESTSNLLLSFQRVIPPPNKTGLSSVFSAGLCSQLEAHEAELRHYRALNRGEPKEALDAQFERDYHLRTTAKRQFRAYKMFKNEYGEPGEGACPVFQNRNDRFYYLMGLLAGVQAANSDFQSGRSVGIPTDVLGKTSRGVQCLESDEWWGVPRALRAVTWTIVPGKTPDDADPWKTLDEATKQADRSGVRLAYAFKAMAADNKGKTERVKETIRDGVQSRSERPPPKKYRLIDAMGFLQMKMVSDRMWTQTAGHRTPPGKLGSFPDTSNDDEEDVPQDASKLLP